MKYYYHTLFTFWLIELYHMLIQLWEEHWIPIDDFTNPNGETSEEMVEVLRIMKKKLEWKRSKMVLLKRIRKISNNREFSVRETKLLRKLINRQKKDGYIDFQEVLFYFPGKTIEILRNKYNEKFNYLTGRTMPSKKK